MKGECPNCGAVYQIDDSKIPDEGGYGRCPKCQTRFFIKKEFSSQPKLMHCPRCGIDVERSNFCSNCGFDFWNIKGKVKGKKDFLLALKKQMLTLKKPGLYLLKLIIPFSIIGAIFFLIVLVSLPFIIALEIKSGHYLGLAAIGLSWLLYEKLLKKVVRDFLDRKLG